MDYKYTNDGKKVVIIGKLNSNETIVQEVYVKNGSEIPSGEHFVVKSLHDEPLETWKSYEQKTREYLEEELKISNKHFESEIRRLNKEHNKLCHVVSQKTKFLKSVAEKFNNDTLNRVFDLLSGKIKYIVDTCSYAPKIIGFNSAIAQSEYNENISDEIRLLTLFGKSDGTLAFKINQWGDGSGSHRTTIVPCKTYENAVKVLSDVINGKSKINENHIETAKEHGIQIKKELLNEYYKRIKKSKTIELEELKTKIKNCEIEIDELNIASNENI